MLYGCPISHKVTLGAYSASRWRSGDVTVSNFFNGPIRHVEKFSRLAKRDPPTSITRSHGSVRVLYGRPAKSMGNAEIWPATTPDSLKRSSPNLACVMTSSISFTKNWAQSVKGFLLPIYAKYTPPCSLRYPIRIRIRTFTTFLVLPIAYSRDACMDFNAYNVKQRSSMQGSAFWGL